MAGARTQMKFILLVIALLAANAAFARSDARHPTAHLIWFLISASGVVFFLSSFIPKIV
jgi:hypothetical protein